MVTITDAEKQRRRRALADHPTIAAAANALGMRRQTLVEWRRNQDPAWLEQAEARGFSPTHSGWIKWPATADQPGASVYVRPQQTDVIEAIRAALDGYDGRADPTPAPQFADADLLNLVAIPDWHAGMLAWRRETGADYDLRMALGVLREGIGRIAPRLPPADVGVILAPGDVTHANDARNVTPRSGHLLSVDGRYSKIMETAASGLIYAADAMLEHHARVEVVLLPGNHDPEAAQMLAFALRLFYSREPRVTVHDGAGLWWRRRHGKCLIVSTHGHQIKQRDMGSYIAAEWPEEWGATRWRFCFSGHIHHERSVETPGMLAEALRPITARDAHAAGAYHSQREITGMTFHTERGRVSRVYEALA